MTRKIEQQMVRAIKSGKQWRCDNTMVDFTLGGRVARVFLHGNHIAEIGPDGLVASLAGWNTSTTRSRITALCHEFVPGCNGVGTRKGVPHLVYRDGTVKPVEAHEWFTP